MTAILFISGNLFPTTSGDAIFSVGLVYRLAKKYDVTVFTYGKDIDLNNSPLKSILKKHYLFKKNRNIRDITAKIFKYGSIKQSYNSEIISVLKEEILRTKYDYILIDHLRSFSLFNEIRKYVPTTVTKVIFVAHNVESINNKERIKLVNHPVNRMIAYYMDRRICSLEKDAVCACDCLWVLSSDDLLRLSNLSNYRKLSKVIPPYYPWKRIKYSYKANYNLLFLGSMNWYPNVLGVLHFIDTIFPILLKSNVRYKLYIVGKEPQKELLRKQSSSVIITGGVRSVDEYILNSDMLVISNKVGTGIKIKFMEAIMKGLPVIMYKENGVGVPEQLLVPPFVVETPFEFARSILLLNNNSEMKRRFVEKALSLFKDYEDFPFSL